MLVHFPVDIGLDQLKKWFVKLHPLEVFARRQSAALATKDPAAHAVVSARKDDVTEQPINRLVGQDVIEQLATVHEKVHQTRPIKNGPRHHHSINELRALDVQFLQNHTANAQRHKMRLDNFEVINHRQNVFAHNVKVVLREFRQNVLAVSVVP